ncbi:proteolipid protein 2b [Silurus meridionalis]|uniref:Proteolipid protein 2 n=1 Tax=Silurus meridionalis TaxID=175797 RepID=A0A8T0ARK1_SILME|nr:proteolipid protein 2b [Silurus meridionalis]KAF7695005.1 hypothetical protein HF521_006728 [Silurus meridionalis]
MSETEAGPSVMEKLKTYVRTRKGTILAGEMLLSLIVTICYAASLYNGYSTVGICELIFAAIFFGIFMMELDKQFLLVNWLWTDFFRAVIGAVLYILTSLICLIAGAGDGARIAGGVFGLIAGILFSYDTYTLITEIRSTRGRSTVSTDA